MSDIPTEDYGALLAKLKGGGSISAPSSEVEKQEEAESNIDGADLTADVVMPERSSNGHKAEIEETVPHPADTARPQRSVKAPAHVPPHDLEAEELVLGAMMVDTQAARALFDIISIEDFYLDAHRRIAECVLELLKQDAPTDPLAVWRILVEHQQTIPGGPSYLATLTGSVTTVTSAPYHATAIAELSARRQLIDAVTIAAEGAYESQPLDEVIGGLGARMQLVARAQEPGFRLFTIAELRGMPAPVDLIEGVISRDVLVTLWGPSGDGKSLLALDMALSVALGRPWLERKVERGPVVMVVAEGASGTAARVDAWLTDRAEPEPDNFFIVPDAVNLFEKEDPQAFVRAVEQTGVAPALVVFDTLARSMVGADENSARDVGVVIAAADWIRSHSRATVLVVHHSGRKAEHERGSTALFAASDTVISAVKNEDDVIVVESRKQKDRADFEPLGLAIQPVDNSVVLVENSVAVIEDKPSRLGSQILTIAANSFGSNPFSRGRLVKEGGLAERSIDRTLKWLVENHFLTRTGATRNTVYELTEKGAALFLP